MKLYRPSHLLPILLLISLASVSECRLQKRALRIFSAPPDGDPNQVYRGLYFPKHIDHVAQGGTIGLEYHARRLAGPVGSVWRRVKKFFRGGYKKDWNDIIGREDDKIDEPWGVGTDKPTSGNMWEGTDKPWRRPWGVKPWKGTDKPWRKSWEGTDKPWKGTDEPWRKPWEGTDKPWKGTDEPWRKSWEGTDKPWKGTDKPWEKPVGKDPAVVTEEVIKDKDITADDRDDDDDDFAWDEIINPRKKNNPSNDFKEDDREKEWTHING